MKNRAVRTKDTGMFIKSNIEIDNPMELALITMSLELLLKQFQEQHKQDLNINKLMNDYGIDELEDTELSELAIEQLSNMINDISVKNEILEIV